MPGAWCIETYERAAVNLLKINNSIAEFSTTYRVVTLYD